MQLMIQDIQSQVEFALDQSMADCPGVVLV